MDVVSTTTTTTRRKKKLIPYTATTTAMTMKVEVKKSNAAEVYVYIWRKNLGKFRNVSNIY